MELYDGEADKLHSETIALRGERDDARALVKDLWEALNSSLEPDGDLGHRVREMVNIPEGRVRGDGR